MILVRARDVLALALALCLLCVASCDMKKVGYRGKVRRLLRANCSENFRAYLETDEQKKSAQEFREEVEQLADRWPIQARNFIDWAYGKPDPHLSKLAAGASDADKALIRNCHRYYLIACWTDCFRDAETANGANSGG